VLLLDAYGAPLGYVLNGVDKLGLDIPIVGDGSVAATGLISSAPPSGVLGTPAVRNLVVEIGKSIRYDASATWVTRAVAAMRAIGPIRSTLLLAYNYDALPLVQAAAEQAGSTDPAPLAKALEDPKVHAAAETAILSRYNYSAQRHDPRPAASEFVFIKPAPIKDGQFQSAGQ